MIILLFGQSPLSSSSNPDYEWMEQYVRATEKEVIGKLYEYRGKEIDVTKEIEAG